MSHKRTLIILFLFSVLTSCNYKFFVNKRYVVQSERGYLVFREDEVIFFPSKDTIDSKFLASTHKKEGYKVEFRTAWLKKLSLDFKDLRVAENASNFSIIPVEITYYLGEMWRPLSNMNSISYKFDNKVQVLNYETADWRQILFISIVRKMDKMRLDTLKIDPPFPPTHWD